MHIEWKLLEEIVEEKAREFLCSIIKDNEVKNNFVEGLKNRVVDMFLQMVGNDKEVPIIEWIVRKFVVQSSYEFERIVYEFVKAVFESARREIELCYCEEKEFLGEKYKCEKIRKFKVDENFEFGYEIDSRTGKLIRVLDKQELEILKRKVGND